MAEYLTLNSDSSFSFQYFISSLSDSLSGTYNINGDTLIFNSFAYKPMISTKVSSNQMLLLFKESHTNEPIPFINCKITLEDGSILSERADKDGRIYINTKKSFRLEYQYFGYRSAEFNSELNGYSIITVWVEPAHAGAGMRGFINEKYLMKRNKLISLEDSIHTIFKYKR